MNTPPISGSELFNGLRAEYEEDWLSQVFVEPPDFRSMAGMHSIVVFGDEGSGKTALMMGLERAARQEGNTPPLLVKWYPTTLETSEIQGDFVRTFMHQVMDACGVGLLRHIGQNPAAAQAAPKWVQDTVIWLLNRYLLGDKDYVLGRLEDEILTEGKELLQNWMGRQPVQVLPPNAPPPRILSEVSTAIRKLGISGVWIMVDGLDPWVDVNAPMLEKNLHWLLSALALFEDPGFCFKLMAPNRIKNFLQSSTGILRRRFDFFNLEWTTEKLVEISERRLTVAVDQARFRLSDLCTQAQHGDKTLREWLEIYGGPSPRGWLDVLRAPLASYLALNPRRSLSLDEWQQIRRQNPPRLHINPDNGQVVIGYGRVENIQPAAYKLLVYLYAQPSRQCTREELYYRVHVGLNHVPRSHDDMEWQPRKCWERVIDTALYRLRQTIEPRPEEPVYILSDRGKSIVRLENAW